MPKKFEIKETPSLLSNEPRELRDSFKTVHRFLSRMAKHISDVYTVEDIDKINEDFDHLPADIRGPDGGSLTVPTGVNVDVTWDTEIFDTYDYFDAAVSNILLNILVGGIYHFTVRVDWSSLDPVAGYIQAQMIRISDGTVLSYTLRPALAGAAPAATAFETQEFNFLAFFPSRDQVKVTVHQTSGADKFIFDARLQVFRVRTYELPPGEREKILEVKEDE